MEEELNYFKDIKVSILESIKKDSLSKYVIKGYLKHLPIKGIHNGWSEDIYMLSEECLNLLFEYSRNKKYIERDTSYEEFINLKDI